MSSRSSEIAREIRKLGWREIAATGGGHRRFVHQDSAVPLKVPFRPSDVNTIRNVVSDAYTLIGLDPPGRGVVRPVEDRRADVERARARSRVERERRAARLRAEREAAVERSEVRRARVREELNRQFYEELMSAPPGA